MQLAFDGEWGIQKVRNKDSVRSLTGENMAIITIIYSMILCFALARYTFATFKYRRLMREMEVVATSAGAQLDNTLSGIKRAREIHSLVDSPQSKIKLEEIETVVVVFVSRLRIVVGLGIAGLILVLFIN